MYNIIHMPRTRSTIQTSTPTPTPTSISAIGESATPSRGVFFRKNIVFIISAIALLACALAGFFYWQAARLKADPQKLAQQEAEELVARVSRLIVLPSDEIPTIATVADPEKLAGQAFFQNAKLGSKVLIYTKARKAVLYDPESDRLLEVAPMSLGDSPEP